MSNFKTFAQILQGYAGTASVRYSASTADNLATITAAGYMNDYANIVKANDVLEVNYSDTTVLPAQITATYAEFLVVASGSDLNLVAYPLAQLGSLITTSVTITAAGLNAGGVVLITGISGQQFRINDIIMNVTGSNMSGGGGDRNMSVTDGTTAYTVIPAANLQSLSNAEWGSAAVPYPVGASINKLTTAGQNLRAVYSGGTANYAAGSFELTIVYNRAV